MRRPANAKKRNLEEREDDAPSSSVITSTPSKRKKTQEINVTEEEEEEEEGTFERDVINMIAEHSKNAPSKKILKSLMERTLTKRRQWIMDQYPTVEEILISFPPLSQSYTTVSIIIRTRSHDLGLV